MDISWCGTRESNPAATACRAVCFTSYIAPRSTLRPTLTKSRRTTPSWVVASVLPLGVKPSHSSYQDEPVNRTNPRAWSTASESNRARALIRPRYRYRRSVDCTGRGTRTHLHLLVKQRSSPDDSPRVIFFVRHRNQAIGPSSVPTWLGGYLATALSNDSAASFIASSASSGHAQQLPTNGTIPWLRPYVHEVARSS